jgi:hypothetical protein
MRSRSRRDAVSELETSGPYDLRAARWKRTLNRWHFISPMRGAAATRESARYFQRLDVNLVSGSLWWGWKARRWWIYITKREGDVSNLNFNRCQLPLVPETVFIFRHEPIVAVEAEDWILSLTELSGWL